MNSVRKKCMVKGCDVTEGLLDPIICVPTKDGNMVALAYHLNNFPLCVEHSNNVRNPYEFFMQKPQLVRRMLRASYPGKATLDFEEMALQFQPIPLPENNMPDPYHEKHTQETTPHEATETSTTSTDTSSQ